MLTINDLNPDHKLVVGIALSFSLDVLHFYEAKHPTDLRPRKSIESAIICLHNSNKEARNAAYATSNAAFEAAADAAGYAGYDAAKAAAYAANAAVDSVNAAAYAAHAVNAAADAYAANAADKKRYIHDKIVKILPLILEYKIENKQSFENAEKVFGCLNDEDKVSFIFNLDILR